MLGVRASLVNLFIIFGTTDVSNFILSLLGGRAFSLVVIGFDVPKVSYYSCLEVVFIFK